MKWQSTLLLVVISLLLIASPKNVSAATSNTPTASVSETTMQPLVANETTMAAQVKKSEYVLPYPGILPDHPLYFLKTFRDRIIEVLVVDPLRRAEFYLLQSDKWLSGAQVLLDKGKKDMAQTLLTESGDRIKMAVDQLVSMKGSGKTIPMGTIDRFLNATQKHIEVLDDLSARSLDVSASRDVLTKVQSVLSTIK